MTNTPTYTGDLLILLNEDEDWDINYINGQPEMTDGFDTAVMLAVFGEPDFWQNDLTDDPNEKYISEFPGVIKNGRVDDDTIKNGIAALNNAMKFMINIGAAESVNVSGGALNVYGLYWIIEIIKGNITTKYTINWDKGVISVAGLPKFTERSEPQKYNGPQLNPDGTTQLNPDGTTQLYEYYE